jgi:ParB family transcriptional regulator, chromosome partitioning protein
MPKASKSKGTRSEPAARPMAGLGRGLTDIIAQGTRSATSTATTPFQAGASVRQIPLSQIVPNPRQPRLKFFEEPLDELVLSIKEHGILQPITVRPQGQNFEIIAGERRFRASQKAGLPAIPAIVKSVSDVEAYELSLIENLQRENLDPIEEARGYRKLADEFSLTQELISQKVGKNRATVANAMRLLDLPEEVQSYIAQGRISIGHAKAILSLSNNEQRIKLAEAIIRNSLNVRQTEALVSKTKTASNGKRSPAGNTLQIPEHLKPIQEALQQKLALKVHIQTVGNGGRVEIHYYTPTDLERLLEILGIQL